MQKYAKVLWKTAFLFLLNPVLRTSKFSIKICWCSFINIMYHFINILWKILTLCFRGKLLRLLGTSELLFPLLLHGIVSPTGFVLMQSVPEETEILKPLHEISITELRLEKTFKTSRSSHQPTTMLTTELSAVPQDFIAAPAASSNAAIKAGTTGNNSGCFFFFFGVWAVPSECCSGAWGWAALVVVPVLIAVFAAPQALLHCCLLRGGQSSVLSGVPALPGSRHWTASPGEQ